MDNRMQLFFYSLILLLLFSGCAKTSAQAEFTIVMSGSMHGQLDPCGWKKNPLGGLSRRYVKVQELRDNGKNPLILDAGDLFFSTTNLNDDNRKAEEFRAGAILDGLNQIGFDAINIGKYELLNGLSFWKIWPQK